MDKGYGARAHEEEVRVTNGRDSGGLIFEIGHDLDEVVMGLYNEEDVLIEVGLHDARRDLAELRNLIAKPEAGEEEDRGPMVRTPAGVIGKIEHDLDQIATGYSMGEDRRINLGLSDARRDLAELGKLIAEESVTENA
uniref:Uncharacterized protein n=1 Tax=viral metagenome TaxID=1070528 RepID=A0A6M3M1J7_9ZZZZ